MSTATTIPPQATATACSFCRTDANVHLRFRLPAFNVMRCDSCGLVFLDSRQDDSELKELYSEDYFRARAEYFFHNPVTDSDAGGENANITEFSDGLKRLRGLTRSTRLLDVGCGVGVFVGLANQQGWHASGLDISEFAAKYGREKLGLDLRQGTLADSGFEPATFDAITMWDMIEHVPDPRAELAHARQLLKPGGYLLLNTPNEAALLKRIAAICYRASLGLFRYPVQKLYHEYHLQYFTPRVMRQILESAGYRIIEARTVLIPIVKARGSAIEKAIVWALSHAEKWLGMEYQLMVIAQNPADGDHAPRA